MQLRIRVTFFSVWFLNEIYTFFCSTISHLELKLLVLDKRSKACRCIGIFSWRLLVVELLRHHR